MRTRVLAALLLLLAGALLMAARPGNEYQLLIQLNGQPTRWTLSDGGRSGVFTTYDAGTANNSACITLRGGTTLSGAGSAQTFTPSTILIVPFVPVNVCARPSSVSLRWDGGCNSNPADENAGVPLSPNVPQYMTLDSQATTLCFATDAGFLSVPVWGTL